MRVAMDETARRRTKQVEFNTINGIVPRSVTKAITDIMEGAREAANEETAPAGKRAPRQMFRVAEDNIDYAVLDPQKLAATIKKLEAQMYKHAQNLEFEEAAQIRDQLHQLRELFIAAS